MRRCLPLLATVTLLAACGDPAQVPARVQLTVAALNVDDPNPPLPEAAPAIPCAGEDLYCSPTNLSGRILKAVAMWGELGPGARAVTLLDGTNGHLDDNSYRGGTMAFSLIDGEIVVSSYEEVDGGGDTRPVPRLEFYYDYLDATLAMGGPLAGPDATATYSVRTVFVSEATADDVSGVMFQGDKLVRAPGTVTWQWCNASGCSANRDDVADGLVVEDKLVNHVHPGQGPTSYIPFAVPLEPALRLSAGQINTPESLWSCGFHMTDAVRMNAAPSAVDSPQALLAAFELAYDPDQQHAGDEVRISARVDFTQGPSEVPAGCTALCARVETCAAFPSDRFGANVADCEAHCAAQADETALAQVGACVAAAPCDAPEALEACLADE